MKCNDPGEMKGLGLPTRLTNEEQALLDKYAFVKKRKKEFNQGSNIITYTSEADVVATPVVKHSIKQEENNLDLPPAAPIDAKEKAKQLLAAGQLKIQKGDGQRSFKRARVVSEKKVKQDHQLLSEIAKGNTDTSQMVQSIKQTGYTKFVPSEGRPVQKSPEHHEQHYQNVHAKKQSNIIFVSGFGLTKNILDDCFTKFGSVTHTHLDKEKGHGFVTFKSTEAAEKAITEMHGELIQGITLKVTFSRNRPFFDPKHRWSAKDHPKQKFRPPRSKDDYQENHNDLGQVPPPVPRERSNIPRLANIPVSTKEEQKKGTPEKKTELLKYSNDDEFDF